MHEHKRFMRRELGQIETRALCHSHASILVINDFVYDST